MELLASFSDLATWCNIEHGLVGPGIFLPRANQLKLDGVNPSGWTYS